MTLGLLAAGCQRDALTPPPGYFQADIEASPMSLDPRFATDAISARIDELVFESMVRLDAHGNFTGLLAESIERPSDTAIIFHLRPDAHFSDGRELTARDVKCTYDDVLAPRTASPKRAGLEPIVSIDAVDDHTVRMTTTRPYAPALEIAMLGIVPCGAPIKGSTVAGSGPFRVASFARDQSVVLERNPMRPRPAPAAQGVIFKIVPDPTVRALELAKGTADFAENNMQPELLGYLEQRPDLRVGRYPGTSYQYLAFNFRDSPLRDVRVRRAIAIAIDRDAIIGSMLAGTAVAASGMLSPQNWAYDPNVAHYGYDPAAARELLDQAGFRDPGHGRARLTFVYKTTPEGRRLGEALQAMLRQVGIALDLRTNEFATFYGDVQRGNFDLTSLAWVGINDPHHYFMVFDSRMTPPHGLNRGYYSNPAMDRLVEAGDTTLDLAARRAIYAQVQQLAADDLPYVSLWWLDTVAVVNRRLVGFAPYPNGSLSSFANLTLAGPLREAAR